MRITRFTSLMIVTGLALVITSCGTSSNTGGNRRDLSGSGDGGGGGGDDGGGETPDLTGVTVDLSGNVKDLSVPGDLAKGPDLVGCGIDVDKDGVSVCQGDCDDNDSTVYPSAKEVCDGKDNNCNGQLDEGFDTDMDGWTTCAGDCNDSDATIHPKAMVKCNGKDNNCNGIVDDNEDQDKDGYTVCNDCDDTNPNVNPGAFEVPGDNLDNNCNGQVDETPPACDTGISFNAQNPIDYAHAMDICDFIVSAQFPQLADSRAHSIPAKWGVFTNKKGVNMAAFSTGIAAAVGDPGYVTPQIGTSFSAPDQTNPLNMGTITCTTSSGTTQTFQDPSSVSDYTEFKLVLKAPTNAESFSFDFNFLSAEYPEFVCTQFNDKFLVLLDSKMTKGNISFDAKGKAVTINNGFFSVTQSNQLTGTGMENGIGGATGWLTTNAPVQGGETITLRFIVFDEGDHIYDSQVLLDNFRWTIIESCGASTGREDGGVSVCDGGTKG